MLLGNLAVPLEGLLTTRALRRGFWSTLSFLASSPDGEAVEGDLIGRLSTMGLEVEDRRVIWKILIEGKLAQLRELQPAHTLKLTEKGRDLTLQLAQYA